MEDCYGGKRNAQELFLIEFLVDKVNIPSVQAMHDDFLQVKTCIEFRILNLPAIFICQETGADNCTCSGDDPQVFRKGKSCLFALPARLLRKPLCSFPIMMSVYKKLPPSVLPDIMTIGACQIEIRDMVNSLLDEPKLEAENPCRTLKSNFQISTATGQCCGEICVFIRFSRLGNKVVTQFQSPRNRKPYLFKGLENSPVFQCRRIPEHLGDELVAPGGLLESCVCNTEKAECKTAEERPAKSCCDESRKSSRGKSGRKSRKSARPCCASANSGGCKEKKSKDCHDRKEKRTSCDDADGYGARAEKTTRQCGCEAKDDKSVSCCN